ncbi:nucleoside deaminase [Nocardioides sp. KR10-350]|uniref:nucleoside deaminase n=1 Tax=Nocardioides cheoyonin TaxID=3156615 RepID=UPI0032B3A754
MSDDETWLEQAIALAVANVADGGGPFGAVVVRDGVAVGTGQNSVTRALDPSAHAEVLAIRAACRTVGDFSLAGCTLYTSCEPCPMCLATSLWARLDRVVYAADRDDAARGGFDDRAFYELFGSERAREHHDWPTRVDELRLADCAAPFDAWLAKDDRTDY